MVDAVIGVRYEGDRVWIDVCDDSGVHSALAPPELDPRRVAALETVAQVAREVRISGAAQWLDAPLAALDAVPATETTSGEA